MIYDDLVEELGDPFAPIEVFDDLAVPTRPVLIQRVLAR